MYYYAFTIRCMNFITHRPTLQDFTRMVQAYKTKYTWTDIRFHLEIVEKQNGNHNVHIHGMISSPKKLSDRMLKSVIDEGYCVTDHDFVKSKAAWTTYITKQKGSEAQLLALLSEPHQTAVEHREDEDSTERAEWSEFYSAIKRVNLFD